MDLLDRLERILPFADIVADKIIADKIVCEEIDLVENTIPRMYEVMHRVAEVSCDSVKCGSWSPHVRTVDGSDHRWSKREMDRELKRVVEDFDCAVNVEALRRRIETGKDPFSQSADRSFSTVPYRATNFD